MADEKNKSRNFKVVKGHAGPFPHGHIFSEDDFKEVHPAPKDIDAAKYHASLINRLLSLGVISKTKDESGETPPGPHTAGSISPIDSINQSVKESQAAADVHKTQQQADLDSAKKEQT